MTVRGGETAVVSATMKFLPIGNGAPRRARQAALAASLLGVLAVPVGAQTQYAAADIEYGSRVYAAQCAVCHGATGDTVNGVDLKSGRFKRASGDFELMAIVATGIAGTAMPAFKFTPAELTGVIAYVRNMRDFRAARVAIGDASRGQALFDGKGRCSTCHRVNGNGPRVAPDLSTIGASQTADMLQRALVDPNGATQFQNRSVRAVTRDGKVIAGRRLNEDTYSVQLIDEQERLVSLLKADLREYTVAKTASMPAYKDTFTPAEVADVVAYLLSLKGL
jgi:putative heme-binding domain-containing protein